MSKPCPVPLPRELSKAERTLWERYYLIDEDYYCYGLALIGAWKSRLPDCLDVLECVAEFAEPSRIEEQVNAVVHMLRRASDDLDTMIQLAYELIPYDKYLLRRIQSERGVVLSVPLATDDFKDSNTPETLQ